MEYKNLYLTLKNAARVLHVTLNRPTVRNAFNAELIAELLHVFSAPARGEGKDYAHVRAVVLSGEGKAFCGGGDLQWMKASLELSEAENFSDCQTLTRMFLAIDRCPLPVVGIVHGFAIGGGVGLAAVCDHVVAAQGCVFSLAEVKLGLVPACIGPFVLGKVGASQCRSLFISGERFGAEKAQKIGLVHDVVPEQELSRHSEMILQQILEGGPAAIAMAKNLLHTLTTDLRGATQHECLDFAAAELARLRVSAEGQEGLKAFLEKRQPNWRT